MQEFILTIGAHVWFQDGNSGTLRQVVIDPQTKRVAELVVAQGFLQRDEHVIPVNCVEKATADAISLSLQLGDLVNYPKYREVELDEELPDWEVNEGYARERVQVWYPAMGIFEREQSLVPMIHRTLTRGIPTGEQVIGRSSVVRNLDGVVGKVDHLLLDRESWEICSLVVRRGLISHFVVIPFAWVSDIAPGEVLILGNNSQLQEVPATRLQPGAHPVDGLVAGAEEDSLDRNLALAKDVLASLAVDPRTTLDVIEVVCEQGVITLLGNVGDSVAHEAAEEIAHRQGGVKSVVNALEVQARRSTITAISGTFGNLMEHAFMTTDKGANHEVEDY